MHKWYGNMQGAQRLFIILPARKQLLFVCMQGCKNNFFFEWMNVQEPFVKYKKNYSQFCFIQEWLFILFDEIL